MVDVRQARPRSPEDVQAEAAERAARLKTLGLLPTDEIRFRKPGRKTSWVYGVAHDVNVDGDGSVDCFSSGAFRAIRPERIEVRWKGPWGALRWEPLIPGEGDDHD